MPSGLAVAVRQQLAMADKAGLLVLLEKSPYSKTGYTNVIKVRGKYQARLQVKGDAERKRYQHPLPGLFETALEAAEYLAIVKRDFGADGVTPPPKQIEHRNAQAAQQAAGSSASSHVAATASAYANGRGHGHACGIPNGACAFRGSISAPHSAARCVLHAADHAASVSALSVYVYI